MAVSIPGEPGLAAGDGDNFLGDSRICALKACPSHNVLKEGKLIPVNLVELMRNRRIKYLIQSLNKM